MKITVDRLAVVVSKMPDLNPNLRRKKCKKRKFWKGSKKMTAPVRSVRSVRSVSFGRVQKK